MGKLIFWLVVFFVILLVLRLINVSVSRARGETAARPKPKGSNAPMIRCVDCGVYLPSADAKPSPRGPVCNDPVCIQRHGR
jgi:hypothetical protein